MKSCCNFTPDSLPRPVTRPIFLTLLPTMFATAHSLCFSSLVSFCSFLPKVLCTSFPSALGAFCPDHFITWLLRSIWDSVQMLSPQRGLPQPSCLMCIHRCSATSLGFVLFMILYVICHLFIMSVPLKKMVCKNPDLGSLFTAISTGLRTVPGTDSSANCC